MPAPAPRALLPRRFVAALLILSVLATTLGWAHPACEMAMETVALAEHAGHGGDMAAMNHGSTERPVSHDCSQHEEHPGQAADCGMVAHCLQGFMVPETARTLAAVHLPDLPAPAAQLAPPGPAPAPESPPPRG